MTDIDPTTDEVRNHELDDRKHAEAPAEGGQGGAPTDERVHAEKPAEG